MNSISSAARLESILQIEPSAFAKQSNQFWILLTAGWLGYALVVFLAIVRPQFDDPSFNLSGQLLNLMLETLSGFLLSFVQWRLIRNIVHLPLKQTLFLSFTSAAILGLLYNVIKLATYKVVVYDQAWNHEWQMLEFGGWLLFSLTTMFVWTSIFFIMLYNTKLQNEHERLLRAETAAKDAQLQMLRYQLNPHFMFNTMNAISTLIYKNENDLANEMLDKLCEFFRISLDKNATSASSIQKELELLDVYLSIEKVRFGDRLNVEMRVAPETLKAKVPSMLLQPLVENAVKYAIEPKKAQGHITLSTKLEDNKVQLRVEDDGNDGQGELEAGMGIGLDNTRARLKMMFSGDCDVSINHNKQGGTTVQIHIPFVQMNSRK